MTLRKLQGEIDRILKKVSEGVTEFDDIIDKVYAATSANQKEKYESDLKKEIKKLQRYRDQIKLWISSPDVKNKTPLTDSRKLIEQKMEQFKACEKETKTKAYSKEGLAMQSKEVDKRAATQNWVSKALSDINTQLEVCESELEGILPKNRKKEADRVNTLTHLIERYKYHINMLEQLLRDVDNEHVSPDKANEVKETIEDYVERNAEPDFVEDEEMYENIGIRLDGSWNEDDDFDESDDDTSKTEDDSSSSGNTTPPTQSVAPIPPPVPTPQAQIKSAPEKPEKPVSKSSALTNSGGNIPTAASMNNTTSNKPSLSTPPPSPSHSVPPTIANPPMGRGRGRGLAPHISNALPTENPSLPINTIPPTPAILTSPHRGVPLTSPQRGVGRGRATLPPSSATSQPNVGGLVERIESDSNVPQPNLATSPIHVGRGNVLPFPGNRPPVVAAGRGNLQFLNNAVVNNNNNNNTNSNNINNSSSGTNSNTNSPSLQNTPSLATKHAALQQQLHNLDISNEAPHPPSTTTTQATPQPQQPQQQQQQQNQQQQIQAPPPQQIQPPTQNFNMIQATNTSPRSEDDNKNAETFGDLSPMYDSGVSVYSPGTLAELSSATLNRMAEHQQTTPPPQQNTGSSTTPSVSEDHALSLAMLDQSLKTIPEITESDRNKYVPRNPCPTPSYYPQSIPPSLVSTENPGLIEKFDTDTLFFVFYYQQGTYQQFLAARELKKQSWRYHKKYLTWFQRHEEPKEITNDYEQGTYVYFDYESGWCQRKKTEFTFEYRYLEE